MNRLEKKIMDVLKERLDELFESGDMSDYAQELYQIITFEKASDFALWYGSAAKSTLKTILVESELLEYHNGRFMFEGIFMPKDDVLRACYGLLNATSKTSPNDVMDVVQKTKKQSCPITFEDVLKTRVDVFGASILDECPIMTLQQYIDLPRGFCAFFASILTQETEGLFVMRGVAQAGKSIIMAILKAYFGDFAVAKQLEALNGNFGYAGLDEALLCFSDDAGQETIKSDKAGNLKTMLSHSNDVEINVKFRQQYQARLLCNFVVASNKDIEFDLCDDGLLRRINILQFTKQAKIERKDYKNIMALLLSKEYLASLYEWAIEYKKTHDVAKELYLLNLNSQIYNLRDLELLDADSGIIEEPYDAYEFRIKNLGKIALTKANYKIAFALLKQAKQNLKSMV